jgi:demethylmenaquinone methyltransferase/2-methoxy-6-polyprenyl-1,4-benzoquinol methylase
MVAAMPADRDREARWFGNRVVDPAEKTPLVRGVFSRVATRYDLMNDLMSGGVHRLWKDRLVAMVAPQAGQAMLDVAGGTGDVARRLLRAAGGPEAGARVIVCDAGEEMVSVGRDKAVDRGTIAGLFSVVGDAEALPMADRSVDLYTIAFGLRNVTRIDKALEEAHRVLKPGGRFFCLEFSRVVSPPLRRAYDAYSYAVIPRLGQAVARDRASYDYLVESIRQFPDQRGLAERMAAAGLFRPKWQNLSAGIAAIHWAWRV